MKLHCSASSASVNVSFRAQYFSCLFSLVPSNTGRESHLPVSTSPTVVMRKLGIVILSTVSVVTAGVFGRQKPLASWEVASYHHHQHGHSCVFSYRVTTSSLLRNAQRMRSGCELLEQIAIGPSHKAKVKPHCQRIFCHPKGSCSDSHPQNLLPKHPS
jgi:hypothetical protein